MKFLSGWKTYIVGAAAILTAIGAHLSGTLDLQGMVAAIFAAIGTMTLRSAITTEACKKE